MQFFCVVQLHSFFVLFGVWKLRSVEKRHLIMAVMNGNHCEDDLKRTLREYCEEHGQTQLLSCWNRLSTSQKEALKDDIQSLRFEEIQRFFEVFQQLLKISGK